MRKMRKLASAASRPRDNNRSQSNLTWTNTRRKRLEILMIFTGVATQDKFLENPPMRKYAKKIINSNY
jgi:hypothetical protein